MHPPIYVINLERSPARLVSCQQRLNAAKVTFERIHSLLLGKKVITLGDAFYNIDGMVTHCPTQQTFNQTLLTIEHQQLDTELVYRFLDYLENEYLLQQSWSNLTDPQVHFNAVAKRLDINQKKNELVKAE